MMNFMAGSRTYTGLVITFLGLIGVSNLFTEAETAQIADLILQVIGLAFAAYGRYKTQK